MKPLYRLLGRALCSLSVAIGWLSMRCFAVFVRLQRSFMPRWRERAANVARWAAFELLELEAACFARGWVLHVRGGANAQDWTVVEELMQIEAYRRKEDERTWPSPRE